jgi:hypothetical protein
MFHIGEYFCIGESLGKGTSGHVYKGLTLKLNHTITQSQELSVSFSFSFITFSLTPRKSNLYKLKGIKPSQHKKLCEVCVDL